MWSVTGPASGGDERALQTGHVGEGLERPDDVERGEAGIEGEGDLHTGILGQPARGGKDTHPTEAAVRPGCYKGGMRFGLDIAQQRMPWSEIADRARFAEGLGFDGIWGFDHFQPMYGEGPGECFEGMTTLAAWSGITERVRLGLLVTGMTYRHPAVFATEAMTIDHASNGRLELTYGAAWFEDEHRALGIPFPVLKDRIDAFEEAVQIVRGLLTTDHFTFEGKHFSTQDATIRPRPVQSPHPPIWIGASGEQRMMPIAGRLRRRVALLRSARRCWPRSRRASPRTPRRPAATRRRSCAPRRCRSRTTSTRSAATSTRGATRASATSCAAGPTGGRAQVEAFASAFLTD